MAWHWKPAITPFSNFLQWSVNEALRFSWAEFSNENSIFNVGQRTKENKMDPQPAGFQVNDNQSSALN